jgi:hypothetical protein
MHLPKCEDDVTDVLSVTVRHNTLSTSTLKILGPRVFISEHHLDDLQAAFDINLANNHYPQETSFTP